MRRGWAHKLDPCGRQRRFGVHKAVLDSTAGFVVAYKSCGWARHLAEKAGAKFVLHPVKGKVVQLGETGGNGAARKPVVVTADGKAHRADLVVVACESPALRWSCKSFLSLSGPFN